MAAPSSTDFSLLYNSIVFNKPVIQAEHLVYHCLEILSTLKSTSLQVAADQIFHKEDKNSILLELSIVRQLYTLASGPIIEETCNILLDNNLSTCMVNLIECIDPLVSYAARKACMAVFINSLCLPKIFQGSLIFLLKLMLREDTLLLEHGLTNSLQLLVDFLKAVRKMDCRVTQSSCTRQKRNYCLTLISSQWSAIVNSITSSLPITQTGTINISSVINQRMLHLILLSLELFKHIELNPSFLQVILPTLQQINDAVSHSGCLICLTRLTDLFKKCIRSVDSTAQHIITLSQCYYFKNQYVFTAIENWFLREGTSMLLLDESLASTDSVKSLVDAANDTLIRKLLIMSLLLATSHIPDRWSPLLAMMHHIKTITSTQCTHYQTVTGSELITRLLLHLVSEQDECLFEALHYCLKLTTQADGDTVSVQELQIDCFVLEFLDSISFDHITLIDFLIDSDNNFDCFLRNYLNYLINTTSGKESLLYFCQRRDERLQQVERQHEDSREKLVVYSSSDTDDEEDTPLMISHSNLDTYSKIIHLFGQLQTFLIKMVERGSGLSDKKLSEMVTIIDLISQLHVR